MEKEIAAALAAYQDATAELREATAEFNDKKRAANIAANARDLAEKKQEKALAAFTAVVGQQADKVVADKVERQLESLGKEAR